MSDFLLISTFILCRDEFSPPPRRRRQDSTMSTGSERNSLPDKSVMDELSEGLEEGGPAFILPFIL